jgi:hypothetical protein
MDRGMVGNTKGSFSQRRPNPIFPNNGSRRVIGGIIDQEYGQYITVLTRLVNQA